MRRDKRRFSRMKRTTWRTAEGLDRDAKRQKVEIGDEEMDNTVPNDDVNHNQGDDDVQLDDNDQEELKRKAEEEPRQEEEKRRRPDQDDAMQTEVVKKICSLSVDVMEMYSPPRVTTQGAKMGLEVGEAMDLTTGWDFRKAADRDRAWAYIGKHNPKLVIGSPMCTMFSKLQALSGWSEDKQRKWCEAREHIKFMIAVYRRQLREGRWFLHEHPDSASSWGLEEVRKLMMEEGVVTTVAHQCMYGLRTWKMAVRDCQQ